MKKWMLLLACLPFVAVTGHAQESRQDASVSAAGWFPNDVTGNAVHQSYTLGIGLLASYRYMITPHSALEANYGWNRDINKFSTSTGPVRVHTQIQEFSAEYVYSKYSWHSFFPFVEGGIGGYFFGPLKDQKSNRIDITGNTNIGVAYGGGVAYELSPSFDIRVAYRAAVVKSPDFNVTGDITKTNRYVNISNPVVGIAYHF